MYYKMNAIKDAIIMDGVINDVIHEECFDDVVKLKDIRRTDDVVRRKITFEVILSTDDKTAKTGSFRVLCQRIAQVFRKYIGDYNIFCDIKFVVNVDKICEPVKMTIAEENYCKEDVNKLMEVNKAMRDFVVPKVVEIIHRKSNRGEFFTVVWADDTKTTVKLMEGDTSDEYTAFLFALGKKLFENKGVGRKFVQKKKEVFEQRIAMQSIENAVRKQELNYSHNCQFDLDEEDMDYFKMYGNRFMSPEILTRALFKRNRRD